MALDKVFYDIPRYKERLQINKQGDVYSLITKKLLKTSLLPTGYITLIIMLKNPRRSKTEYIHRLLMETFCPTENSQKLTINHKDGNKANNHLENLEWCTQKYNNQHAIDNKLRTPNFQKILKQNINKRSLTKEEVIFIRSNLNISTTKLSKMLNKPKYVIYDVKRKRTWKELL